MKNRTSLGYKSQNISPEKHSICILFQIRDKTLKDKCMITKS